jgi:hypothetical protein
MLAALARTGNRPNGYPSSRDDQFALQKNLNGPFPLWVLAVL